MGDKFYALPKLEYGLKDLEPSISEAQLTLHYEKHHQAYVNGANNLLKKFDEIHQSGADYDVKAALKELSFNIGGHVLHFLYWGNLAPMGKGGGGEPSGKIADILKSEFGSVAQFRKEFTKTAMTVEGSGWGALTYCRQTERPILMQIEKHNVNVYPMFKILLVADVWEHAYYLDYKNDRAKYLEGFWNIINWDAVNKRLEK